MMYHVLLTLFKGVPERAEVFTDKTEAVTALKEAADSLDANSGTNRPGTHESESYYKNEELEVELYIVPDRD